MASTIKLRTLTTAAVALVLAIDAGAQQTVAPFLSVDINGAFGENETGFTAWDLDTNPGVLGTPISNTFDSVTVDLTAFAPAGTVLASRDRDVNLTGPPGQVLPPFGELYDDFIFVGDNGDALFGDNFFQIDISGLDGGATYELTFYTADQAAATVNTMGFTFEAPTPFALGNQPALAAQSTLGGELQDTDDPLIFAAVLQATASAGGDIQLFAFNVPNSTSGQLASILNGFEIGFVSEAGGGGGVVPATAALPAGLVLMAILGLTRRRRPRT